MLLDLELDMHGRICMRRVLADEMDRRRAAGQRSDITPATVLSMLLNREFATLRDAPDPSRESLHAAEQMTGFRITEPVPRDLSGVPDNPSAGGGWGRTSRS